MYASTSETTRSGSLLRSLVRPLKAPGSIMDSITAPSTTSNAGDDHGTGDNITTLPPTSSSNMYEKDMGTRIPSVHLVAAQDQLATFRTLVGIDNAPALNAPTSFFRPNRPAPNIGIYGRVVYAESRAHRAYRVFSFVINACLAIQIIAAAALTALGAANGSHQAVTAFGAINTVIAGFLAYLKGSGLPNRLKYYELEWTKIREYIEQRERDFCRQEHGLDLEAEVFAIERMYEETKNDIEANTPDSFVSKTAINSRRQAGGFDAPALEAGPPPDARSVANMRRTMSYHSLPPDRAYGGEKAGYQSPAYPAPALGRQGSQRPGMSPIVAERPRSEQTAPTVG